MIPRWSVVVAVLGIAGVATPASGQEAKASTALRCTPQNQVEGRASPYDSVAIAQAGIEAKVCYGRPSMRGRTIFGAEGQALVPYGKLWRTGANEPTIIHLASAAEIAGIAVDAGSYSIYTIPGAAEWTVIVNRSISQWGHESRYTAEVQAQEVGRATVKAERLDDPVEQFTIRSIPGGQGGAELVLEWERTRVRIPVTPRRS